MRKLAATLRKGQRERRVHSRCVSSVAHLAGSAHIATWGFVPEPSCRRSAFFVAAAPAGDCPEDGELDDEFIVEGQGTALLSLTPFARVAGLAVPLLGAPMVPFDPGLVIALLAR